MAAPDEREKKLIAELRNNVSDILNTEEHVSDAFLIRWLRARDQNVNKAENMIRHSFKWREEMDVDNVRTRKLDEWYSLNFPYWSDGKSIQGLPVIEMPLGAWDISKAVVDNREEDFVHYANQFFENILQKIRESNAGKSPNEFPNTQCIIVVDWTGYSYAQLMNWKALKNILNLASTYEAHYPEILFKCHCINCPSIFPIVMGMIKHLIAQRTLSKIYCTGSPTVWGPMLAEDIDKSQLATFIGGTQIRLLNGKEYKHEI